MDLYWLLEIGDGTERALAVVGVDRGSRSYRPLGDEDPSLWPPVLGELVLHPVRTKPLTDDLDEALEILVNRVGAAVTRGR